MQLNKFIQAPRDLVYRAFTEPRLLEQWCYPEGFTLKLPVFDLKENGQYRYIHTNQNGEYNCYGKFLKIIPNEKLEMMDESVVDPTGKKVFENLHSSVYFHDQGNGTEVTVIQQGFTNDEAARQCEQGWVDCLINLSELLEQKRNSARPHDEQHMEL